MFLLFSPLGHTEDYLPSPPNAELMLFEDGVQMYQSIPEIVARVREFLLS